MKQFMIKNLILAVVLVVGIFFLSACSTKTPELIGMPNPWVECEMNLTKAAKTAGFTFPLTLSNYKVRAMKDMIEITYLLDENREVTVRKATEKEGITDISGDYNTYPVKEHTELFPEVWADIRRDNEKIYVVNFAAESGVYSIDCPKGMSMDEVRGVFKVIEEAEAPKNIP